MANSHFLDAYVRNAKVISVETVNNKNISLFPFKGKQGSYSTLVVECTLCVNLCQTQQQKFSPPENEDIAGGML